MSGLTFIILFFVVGTLILGLALYGSVKADETKTLKIRGNPELECAEVFNSGRYSIAIDQHSRKIRLADGLREAIIGFDELLSAEVVEGGVSITNTNRGSQLGRVVAGGVLGGGVGAIIGGLSASTTTRSKGTISLDVQTSASTLPHISIPFINFEVDKSSNTYKVMRAEAMRWHARLAAAMRQPEKHISRSDGKSKETGKAQKRIGHLAELVKLRKEGLLSEEEFKKAKADLFNGET